jgi:hypothetical protein
VKLVLTDKLWQKSLMFIMRMGELP